jgi:hypothetical protein
VQPQPSEADVRAAVVRVACAEHLVTRHTAAVGVLLQRDPLDPGAVKKVEVPLAVPHGAIHFGGADSRPQPQECFRMLACSSFSCSPTMLVQNTMCVPAPGGGAQGRAAYAKQVMHQNIDLLLSRGEKLEVLLDKSEDLSAQAAKFRKCSRRSSSSNPLAGMLSSLAGAASSLFSRGAAKGGQGRAPSAAPCKEAVAAPAAPAPAPEQQQQQPVARSPAATCEIPEARFDEFDYVNVEVTSSTISGKVLEDESVAPPPPPPAPVPAAQPVAPMGADRPAPAPAALSPDAVLSLLNLRRGVEGCWGDDDDLVGALVSQAAAAGAGAGGAAADATTAAAVAAVRAARPAGLSGGQWASVLALAFLRKHCGGRRGVWEGMEAKAMAALAEGWPAGVKPLGFTILTALKLV